MWATPTTKASETEHWEHVKKVCSSCRIDSVLHARKKYSFSRQAKLLNFPVSVVCCYCNRVKLVDNDESGFARWVIKRKRQPQTVYSCGARCGWNQKPNKQKGTYTLRDWWSTPIRFVAGTSGHVRCSLSTGPCSIEWVINGNATSGCAPLCLTWQPTIRVGWTWNRANNKQTH